MVSKSFTGANQTSDPVFLPWGRSLAFSLSGTFSATIAIQRILQDNPAAYPESADAGWNTVISYTAGVEQKIDVGEGCWYRGNALFTAAVRLS